MAVLDELSEVKRLEPLVAEDAVDFMLAPSNDRRWPDIEYESLVDTESYVPCWGPLLLPGRPHC
jgi:hypothetical protein